jgi:hypothetical protein
MNTTLTPDKVKILSEIGGSQAVIAVGVVVGPEHWDHVSNGLLSNALLAGLKRGGVEPSLHDGFYCRHKSVKMYVLPREARAGVVPQLKSTLAELRFLEHSTIAHMTSDSDWHVVHDGCEMLPGTTFQGFFLQPEYIESFQEEEAARVERSKAFVADWKSAYLEEKQKREDADKGDKEL